MRRTGGRPQGVLVGRQQDTSGDYGYDLAHEATGRQAAPRRPTGDEQPRPRLARTAADADADGDLEYDEAHDF